MRALVGLGAVLFLLTVAADWLALRCVGEDWWPTTMLLYVPQVLLLAPLVGLALLLALIGPRRLLVLHGLAAAILLFPVLGLELGGPDAPAPGAPHLRILSYNADSGAEGMTALGDEIVNAAPDVVVLQESTPEVDKAVAARLPGFVSHESTQFALFSRWPIVATLDPPKVVAKGLDRSPRFMRYTLDTPLGRLDVFNVHPISPREGLESVRGTGFVHQIESGSIFHGDKHTLVENTALRRMQAEAIAALAAASANPVIIAGDTNLPGPSRIFTTSLSRWQDGFAAAGRGLGYTFPAGRRFAWMRIDRILAGPALRFLDFAVGSGRGSDHYCVWADIERARR